MSLAMDTSGSTNTNSLAAPPPVLPAPVSVAEAAPTAISPLDAGESSDDPLPVTETPEAQFWAVLKENPSDFDTWVKLLQIVEQQDRTFAAREAFDAFLNQFPYCYGYWKKYADYEQRQSGREMAKDVYNRGLAAVPLSVDLWLQYATFTDQTSKLSDLEKIEEVQAVYEAAVGAAGLDFRSDRLWEAYIDWQKGHNRLKETLILFDRVLRIPTQQYSKHFDRFKELVTSQRPVDILSDYEYSQLYHEVDSAITAQEKEASQAAQAQAAAGPSTASLTQASLVAPGTATPSTTTATDETTADGSVGSSHEVASANGDVTPVGGEPNSGSVTEEAASSPAVANNEDTPDAADVAAATAAEDIAELKMLAEQEALAKRDVKMVAGIRERAIAARFVVHRSTEEEVRKRWSYEEGIKRPYFHVKPLERSQLKNWRDYLEFETKEGNSERIKMLFERCLVSCALYEDFWVKYIKYLESTKPEQIRSIYKRACQIHLKRKPNIHLAWAAYEEAQGNIAAARQTLADLDAAIPHIVLIKLHRISLERRHAHHENVIQLFEDTLAQSSSAEALNFYSWRYARFLSKVCKDIAKACTVMEAAIEKDPGNKRLYQQLLSLELSQGDATDTARIEAVFTAAQNSSALSQTAKQGFCQRRLQFLEEFGADGSVLMEAHETYQKMYKKSGGGAKKRSHSQVQDSSGGAAVKVPRTEDSTAAGDDSQQNSAFANANRALQAMQAASGTTQQPYGYGAQQQQQPWMQIQYATTGQAATAAYQYPAVAGQTWQTYQYQ